MISVETLFAVLVLAGPMCVCIMCLINVHHLSLAVDAKEGV